MRHIALEREVDGVSHCIVSLHVDGGDDDDEGNNEPDDKKKQQQNVHSSFFD